MKNYNNNTSEKGMTLVELVVYMLLAFLLMAPVIMLMTNSSKTMARDSSTTNLRMAGQDILNIIHDDLRNTGFRINPDSIQSIKPGVVISGQDNASFTPNNNPVTGAVGPGAVTTPPSRIDTFNIIQARMGRLSSSGQWCRVDTVTYYVNSSGNLIRRAKGNTTGQPSSGCPRLDTLTTIASNVAALQFEYSDDLIRWDKTSAIPAASPPANFCRNNICRGDVEYVRASILLRDPKRLSPVNRSGTMRVGNINFSFPPNDQSLYELHSIVIPIPNNAL